MLTELWKRTEEHSKNFNTEVENIKKNQSQLNNTITEMKNILEGIKSGLSDCISPGGSDGKVSVCNVGDRGLIPGSGRSPGEGNGNPLQYSCLENPQTEEPGRLQSMGLQKSRTQLSDFTYFTK